MQLRILLTGSSGMVGRNILERAELRGWSLVSPPHADLDLLRFDDVLRYFKAAKPDLVIHSAGRVGGIQANVAAPVDFLVTNLDLGRNVILASRAAGVPRLINLGSSCMYPRNGQNPLHEEQVLQGELEPTNEGYALAKIFAARLCRYIHQEDSRFHYKTLIPCNLYGRHDKFAPEHSHLVPAIIHKVHSAKAEGKDTVEIWGDGTARREFMFASDLADAVLRAVDQYETLPDLMNVGLGTDYSINDYYAVVAEIVGWRGRFVHDLSRPVGMKQKLVSIDRQVAWGWRSATSLRSGIEQTYEFYLKEYLK